MARDSNYNQSELQKICNEAILYELGIDRPKNLQTAKALWEKAADSGSEHALAKLGRVPDTGSAKPLIKAESQNARQKSTDTVTLSYGGKIKRLLPKILVVESDLDALEAAVESLNREHFKVIAAPSGQEGLTILGRNPDVRVIYLNQKLSDIDGLQFVKILQKMQIAASASIVVGSSITTGDLVQKAKQLGVKSWLALPCEAEKFEKTIVGLV